MLWLIYICNKRLMYNINVFIFHFFYSIVINLFLSKTGKRSSTLMEIIEKVKFKKVAITLIYF